MGPLPLQGPKERSFYIAHILPTREKKYCQKTYSGALANSHPHTGRVAAAIDYSTATAGDTQRYRIARPGEARRNTCSKVYGLHKLFLEVVLLVHLHLRNRRRIFKIFEDVVLNN